MRHSIRDLGVEDLEMLARWGEPFYVEANFPGTFKPELFIENWRVILSSGFGHIFGLFKGEVLVGTLGCLITPDLNTGDQICTEAFWFVSKENRGAGIRLLELFERWAWAQGVKRINVAHPSTPEMEKLSGLYKRRGYRAVEVHFTKEG